MAIQGISFIERLIDADQADFTPDVARYFLSFHFSNDEHARYEYLAGKAAAGALSPAETQELDEFLAANALLSVLQSKARLSIRQKNPAA